MLIIQNVLKYVHDVQDICRIISICVTSDLLLCGDKYVKSLKTLQQHDT